MVWLAEFFGCMTMAIDFLIIGGRNNAITGFLRTLTMLTYFILLPLTFLFNCSETKDAIIDHCWKTAFTGVFKPKKKVEKEEVSGNTIGSPKIRSLNTLENTVPKDSNGTLSSTIAATSTHLHKEGDKNRIRPLEIENIKRRQAWT